MTIQAPLPKNFYISKTALLLRCLVSAGGYPTPKIFSKFQILGYPLKRYLRCETVNETMGI